MAPGIMCFGKKPEDPLARRNEEIEKVIRNDRKKQQREVKLLLLGTHAIEQPPLRYADLTSLQEPERVANRRC